MSAIEQQPKSGSVVSVGTFDGVHLGHQYLISRSIEAGAAAGLPVYVVTFDRHPLEILRPDGGPRLLTGLEHKLELLNATGVDEVVVLRFDHARAAESAEDFVAEYLVGELGARAIFVGSSFRFGAGARGNVAMLDSLAETFGFTPHGVDLVTDDETKTVVSSTRIRELVARGELAEAAKLLGRAYEVRGTLLPASTGAVVHGRFALPPQGDYRVEVSLPGERGQLGVAAVPEVDVPTAEVLVSFGEADPVLEGVASGAAVAIRFL